MQDINFWGSVYPTHFAIPHLMKTNGKIIVNASAAGVLNPPRGGFYSVKIIPNSIHVFSRKTFLI